MLRSSHRLPRPVAALAALAAASALSLAPVAGPVLAASPPTMDAHALIGGHVRVGSWMAIEVDVENGGPPITGELRLAGGSQGRTRFGVAVDLPTGSRQAHVLYVQPPAFGDKVDVALIGADGRAVASKKVPYVLHEPTQLLVGIVADRPDKIVEGFRLGGDQGALPPATAILAPEDLPERVEAWGALDRLIWQDVDTARLSPAQVIALRGWLAGGGRLIVVGGTAGPASLAGLPDAILPYRPTATIDAPAETLRSLLGTIPVDAVAVPALAGSAGEGGPWRPSETGSSPPSAATATARWPSWASTRPPPGSPPARPPMRCGAVSSRVVRAAVTSAAATTASWSRRWPACRRWPCPRSAG